MTTATPNVSQVQASTYLQGATDVTLRSRPVLGWLDKAGRISRNATGKDWNWRLRYKAPTAQPYTAYQTFAFTNDNYWLPASVTPEWWFTTSGMDITEGLQNTGPSQIVDAFGDRVRFLSEAMEIYLAKSMYMDYGGTGSNRIAGIGTFCKKSLSLATTNADRLAPPISATYAGLNVALGSNGGSWSANISQSAGKPYPMSTTLGTDWPDGQGDPSQTYDATSPRLYNENCARWADPAAAAGAGTWRTHCVAMLSRANTDLKQVSIESMAPTMHISGAQRHQDIKDKLREAFRDVVGHGASESLGYRNVLNFEDAAIIQDHECPADRTYSICDQAVELYFYAGADGGQMLAAQGMDMTRQVTGGIYQLFGPQQIPGTLTTGWVLFAGGQSRWNPKWTVCHKDWT